MELFLSNLLYFTLFFYYVKLKPFPIFNLYQISQVPRITVARQAALGDSEDWPSSRNFVTKCEYKKIFVLSHACLIKK